MAINTNDMTVERKYLDTYRFMIKEYEQVKSKQHPVYKYVEDLYKCWGTNRKSFLKYYWIPRSNSPLKIALYSPLILGCHF